MDRDKEAKETHGPSVGRLPFLSVAQNIVEHIVAPLFSGQKECLHEIHRETCDIAAAIGPHHSASSAVGDKIPEALFSCEPVTFTSTPSADIAIAWLSRLLTVVRQPRAAKLAKKLLIAICPESSCPDTALAGSEELRRSPWVRTLCTGPTQAR